MQDTSTSTSTKDTCKQGVQTTIYWDPVHKQFGTVQVRLEDSQYIYCSYIFPHQCHKGGPCTCESTIRWSVHPRQWSDYLVHCNTSGDSIPQQSMAWHCATKHRVLSERTKTIYLYIWHLRLSQSSLRNQRTSTSWWRLPTLWRTQRRPTRWLWQWTRRRRSCPDQKFSCCNLTTPIYTSTHYNDG